MNASLHIRDGDHVKYDRRYVVKTFPHILNFSKLHEKRTNFHIFIRFSLCMCLVLCHSIPHILSNDKRIKFKINKPFVQKVSCVMPLFCFNIYMNVCWCVCVF